MLRHAKNRIFSSVKRAGQKQVGPQQVFASCNIRKLISFFVPQVPKSRGLIIVMSSIVKRFTTSKILKSTCIFLLTRNWPPSRLNLGGKRLNRPLSRPRAILSNHLNQCVALPPPPQMVPIPPPPFHLVQPLGLPLLRE